MKIKLSIGEFSKLCYVTVKTLRHYERQGLLVPHDVDEWTRYRYYDVSQMERVARIRELKALGLTLSEIGELFDQGQALPDAALVGRKIEQTQQQLNDLRQRLLHLRRLAEQTTKQHTMSKITVKPLPGGVVASWRCRLKSYQELGPKLMSVVQPEMQRVGCVCPPETEYCFTVDYNSNHTPGDIDLEYCEIVDRRLPDTDILKFRELPVVPTAACLGHRGDYDSLGTSVAELFRFIEEHGYAVAGQLRFNYIHGVWDRDDVADWLTELQLPVTKE